MVKKRETLAEYLFRTVGFRKGTRAAAFIAAWGIYSDQVPEGEAVNLFGYTKFWKSSQATTYRELATFHEAFPDEALPDRLWAQARAAVEARKSLPSATAQLMGTAGTWP
jgi:hypothetical protein